jgi:hypothetical protein
MSRTTLCVLTAAGLVVGSLSLMLVRRSVLGDEIRRPVGLRTWKVIMVVQGTTQGQASLRTGTPLDLERQQVLDSTFTSEQLTRKGPEHRHPRERRPVWWTQPAGAANGSFRVRCEYQVALDVAHPSALASRTASGLYEAPRSGEYLGNAPLVVSDHEDMTRAAQRLTAGVDAEDARDTAEALYRYVAEKVQNEPSYEGSPLAAVECLRQGRGDHLAKSRLLLGLLRNRHIPARLVAGIPLALGPEHRTHFWVEAWVAGHWLPMCPFYRHFGKVPATYLIFGFGDRPLARGTHIKDLTYAFLVERLGATDAGLADSGLLHRIFRGLSLFQLPAAERQLVEILLLLPIAALIICVFRNLIGLASFGTFAPALIGLAFHDLHSLPGLAVFVTILLIGWLMRRVLDHYHLLQVPRIATMLTLIMCVLITVVVLSNQWGAPTTRYISLFPMIILCGMVERFWTLETEDSTSASFRTLLQTLVIATTIALVLSWRGLVHHLFRYPETLGLVMAAQLLIGRYTGYRFMELLRFRDFLKGDGADHPWIVRIDS